MELGIAFGAGSVVVDKGGRFLHIFGAHTVQPDDGDSITTWHHYLMDVDTLAVVRGASHRGDSVDLRGAFAHESVSALAEALRTPLAIVGAGDGEASDDIGLSIVDRDLPEPDRAPPEPLPADALVFWEQPRDRFDVELRRRGATVGRWSLGGDPGTFRHVMRLARHRVALFYYREAWGARIGAGLAILDLKAATLEDRGFIRVRG